jgi:hypothetical protein
LYGHRLLLMWLPGPSGLSLFKKKLFTPARLFRNNYLICIAQLSYLHIQSLKFLFTFKVFQNTSIKSFNKFNIFYGDQVFQYTYQIVYE